ncbi:phosphatidylglycerophosphate synthase [Friedmanniella endophytica]|uniref:Phosphatidylglycerophosphate synthase n=1 Tax=Microlunatus kandeliicorticis TaxID=1759536 RepID=A0A7W3IVT7_9ACTN|nr:CDP-alcohol phosphatidyltransferase family protein [Microlunatus kandeliicorticis]MBA8796174.1 phosphatidylglycerophosphate synthase [Microlunatus kandeliicorticis]
MSERPASPADAGPGSAVRDNHPSLAELRAVAQPPSVVGRRNSEHWAGSYLRRGSIHLTRLLLPTGISANGVTWMFIAVGILGALVLVLPGWWPFLACAVLIQLHILIDCSDGEVARWRDQRSASGVYIDRVGHYLVESLLPVCLGVHLDGGIAGLHDGRLGWTTIGALVAVVVILKKSFGDLLHVARNAHGWTKMSEDAEIAAPRSAGLRSLRGMLRFFPFFRAFGAIEFSLILLVVATLDLVLGLAGAEPAGAQRALQVWMVVCIPLALLTAGGYLISILASSRLRQP